MSSKILQLKQILKTPNNQLLILLFLLNLTVVFGIGFKNSVISSVLILVFLLSHNQKFEYKKALPSYLLVGFLTTFIISLFFRQTPYGFLEFSTLGLGALLSLSLSNFQLITKKLTSFLSNLTALISIYATTTLVLQSHDRTFGLFHGAEQFTYYPNAFADLLIVSITLSVIHLFQSKANLKYNKLPILVLFINLIAFWLTFSRSAYLSLAVALFFGFFVLLFQKKETLISLLKKGAMLLLVSLFALSASMVVSLNSEYSSDFIDRVQTSDPSSIQSATERPNIWSGAISIFQGYPIFGSGAGSFEYMYPQYQKELLAKAPHAHNLFLKILSENGLITFIPFLLLLLAAFHPKNLKTSLPVYIAFLSLNIHFLFDYNLDFPLLASLYFILLGQLLYDQSNIKFQKDKLLKITGFLLTIIFIVVTILQAYGYYYIKKIETSSSPTPTYLTLAQIAPFKHQLYSLDHYPVKTTKYPNFHPQKFLQISTSSLSDVTIEDYESLLNLDPKNNLKYYLSFLKYLQSNDSTVLIQKEPEIYDLIQNYITLLNVNAHNTVATQQPQFAYQITELYINQNTQNNWQDLQNQLVSIYQAEKNKFQTRFNYPLPEINDPIQNTTAS